jgi:hypothetical protein
VVQKILFDRTPNGVVLSKQTPFGVRMTIYSFCKV